MKIKIIDRYIYSSLILPSIFGISIFTFILMLNVVMEVMERLFASDLPFISIIDYFLYAVPGILVQTIPMGAFLGGVLGVLKTTFIIFIIYIVVLVGSSYSKRLKEIRDESILVSKITEYIYGYSQGFPEFIQKDVNSYRKKVKEKEIEKNVLKELKEGKKQNNIK